MVSTPYIPDYPRSFRLVDTFDNLLILRYEIINVIINYRYDKD